MAGFKTPTAGIIGNYVGLDEDSGMHVYEIVNEETGAKETVQSPYPLEDTEDATGRRVPGVNSRLNVDLDPGLLEKWAPNFRNLQSRDQRGYYQRAIAPVFRAIPAYWAGAIPDIAALMSYVPTPMDLAAMGYEALTGDDPLGVVERRREGDLKTRKFAKEYGSKAQQIRFQRYVRQADAYFQDKLGFKPFEDTLGTDMTPKARDIWGKMLSSGVEFAVSGPVMVKGVTLPAKVLQDGAKFIYAKMAKDSVRELGEAALKPENIRSLIDKANDRSLIDKANDAYSLLKKQGRINIAQEMALGALAGPMVEGSLHLLKQADPDAAGWVKMLTAIGVGIAGPVAVRGALTSLLQGPAIKIAAKVFIDPLLRPSHAAAAFVQLHLGGTKADRVTIASTARLLEESIKHGRHLDQASGLAFTTPELARTEANILRAKIQLKRERLSQETSPEVRRRLEQEIEADEMTVGNLNRTAKFYEDVLESAAADQTPGAAARFFQNEASRLVQRRDQFFNYIEGHFKRAYDELDFNGKPGGTLEEHRIDYQKAEDPGYTPEFESTRRKLVMEGDPKGVAPSELLWLDPQTEARVKGIQQDLSAKMDEALVKAQAAAQDRVGYWKENVQSYLANRGLKSVDDLSETERGFLGDLIRGNYDDAGREWRALVKTAYGRVDGINVKVTENIKFPEGSRDPSNGADISGMTPEAWATSRFENFSPGEAFNLKLFPPQLAQLAGSRSLVAWINRVRREEEAAGRISRAEEAIPNLERRRDDAIVQRDDANARLTEQLDADRKLSENNMRVLGSYVDNAIKDLDAAGGRAVIDFASGSQDWAKMSAGTARGLAPKGLETVFAKITEQRKRILELGGEGVTFSPAARALDEKMQGFAATAKKAQDSIDDITNKALGLDSDIPIGVTGRLTAQTPEGVVIRDGTSADDVVEFVSELAEAARVEKALNGRTIKHKNILEIRETVEQLLDSRAFPGLDSGQLNFAREANRVRRAVDEAQGPILEKDRGAEVKVEVELVGETVLPSQPSATKAAASLRQLQEATAEVPDFVTITRGEDGIPVAAIDEAALGGDTSLFARADSPFEMVSVGQAGTPFEIRVKPDVPATERSLVIAEAIVLERLALKFTDGVDSKGLESFRAKNKAAINFLEDNGRAAIPDLVKDADSLALQLDAIRSLRQDKTRRLLTEMERTGALNLNGLQIDDFVQYIGNRRKRISEDRAFSEVLNADPGLAVETLFERILNTSNKRPKQDMQEFMSLVRGNKPALKGFQASVVGQLFARALSRHDLLLKETGDIAFQAFDPVKFRELIGNPRVRIIIQEAFPDNPHILPGLKEFSLSAFETSNFLTGSGALASLKPSEAVNLEGWAFLGRISALGAANQTHIVNALWAGSAGARLGSTLGRKVTGAKIKDIVIDAALDPEKGVALSLRTSDQTSGFWRTVAQAAIDVINVPEAVVRRPAAALPVIERGEEESYESVPPGPRSSLEPVRARPSLSATEIRRSPVGASILSQPSVSPVGRPPGLGPTSPDTLALGQRLFPNDPIFVGHGGLITGGAGSGMGRAEQSEGIMSIRHKPRQLVG